MLESGRQRRLSLDRRHELGRTARRRAPRRSHGEWEPPTERADPIAALQAQDAQRIPVLVPVRHARMASSAFAFYRATAGIMAADLAGSPDSGLTVQCCGDAHLSNFGVYASPERRLVFDLNDFDETLPGPWEWDVKRLVASLVMAARHNEFPDGERDAPAYAAVHSYRTTMAEFASMPTLEVWYASVDADSVATLVPDKKQRKRTERTLRKARTRTNLQARDKLTELGPGGTRRIRSDPPLLVPVRDLTEHLPADEIERRLTASLEGYLASLPPSRRSLMDRFAPLDVALKVVGVGSVGTRCFVVLLEGRDDGDPLFLQVKEAGPSALEPYVGPSDLANAGKRVVEGQRLMQAASDIFLGWSEGVEGHHFYWRQLRDMKGSADPDSATPAMLTSYAQLCGWTLARAHARSGDPVAISAYLGSSDRFDRAIVEFGRRYADQVERDYAAFLEAHREGRLDTFGGHVEGSPFDT